LYKLFTGGYARKNIEENIFIENTEERLHTKVVITVQTLF